MTYFDYLFSMNWGHFRDAMSNSEHSNLEHVDLETMSKSEHVDLGTCHYI